MCDDAAATRSKCECKSGMGVVSAWCALFYGRLLFDGKFLLGILLFTLRAEMATKKLLNFCSVRVENGRQRTRKVKRRCVGQLMATTGTRNM